MENKNMITTGLSAVDEMLGSFTSGNLYAVASRPGIGKTMFFKNVMNNILKSTDNEIFYFAEQIHCRMGISDTRFHATCVSEISKVLPWVKEVADKGIVIIDNLLDTDSVLPQLKEIAKEENALILIAVELSRKLERRKDKRPRLSDLNGADTALDGVVFLYRDCFELTNDSYQAEVIIAKNPNGSTGTAIAGYDSENFTYFEK